VSVYKYACQTTLVRRLHHYPTGSQVWWIEHASSQKLGTENWRRRFSQDIESMRGWLSRVYDFITHRPRRIQPIFLIDNIHTDLQFVINRSWRARLEFGRIQSDAVPVAFSSSPHVRLAHDFRTNDITRELRPLVFVLLRLIVCRNRELRPKLHHALVLEFHQIFLTQ
jgi:hypothetical protein